MGGRRRRWAVFMVIMIANIGVAACNALNGEHDRVLADTDSSVRGRDSSFDVTVGDEKPLDLNEGGTIDADADAPPPVFFTVSSTFDSINGATSMMSGGGTVITAYDGSADHPIIVPVPQPATTSDDYTVYATVKLPQDGEFGVLVRIQGTGDGYVFGSKFGPNHNPYLGSIGPPSWNPTDDTNSSSPWIYVANHEYNLKVNAKGTTISAKLWDTLLPEPLDYDLVHKAPAATGRSIGLYTYGLPLSIFKDVRVSVP